MKKLLAITLLLGLVGCSSSKQESETTIIYKRQLYETIFEWACYREAAIVAYAKLHNVSREQATTDIEKIVQKAKDDVFEAWYEKQKEQGKI